MAWMTGMETRVRDVVIRITRPALDEVGHMNLRVDQLTELVGDLNHTVKEQAKELQSDRNKELFSLVGSEIRKNGITKTEIVCIQISHKHMNNYIC